MAVTKYEVINEQVLRNCEGFGYQKDARVHKATITD
jgi:hypothetical protein